MPAPAPEEARQVVGRGAWREDGHAVPMRYELREVAARTAERPVIPTVAAAGRDAGLVSGRQPMERVLSADLLPGSLEAWFIGA